MKIPVYQPFFSEEEKENVIKCLDSTWISSKGFFIEDFEKKFAEYVNCKYASTCSNGTTALHLALLALDIKENDEIIVPTFTYIASVNCIRYVGAIPVFVDSDIKSMQLDVSALKSRLTSKTKAIIIPHLYGGCCDIEEIIKIAKEKNIYVVEDTAEGLGCIYKGKHLGTFGDIGTFSFFGNKTLTTGEGGMVISNNRDLINKIRHYKSQGLASVSSDGNIYPEFWHNIIGYNYRMTNICAAIGVAQLKNIDQIVRQKRDILKKYRDCLKNVSGIHLFEESSELFSSYWMISMIARSEEERDNIRKQLADRGIETRPFFKLAHTMPMYKQYTNEKFPGAEYLSTRGFNVPSYPDLNDKQIEEICAVISLSFKSCCSSLI